MRAKLSGRAFGDAGRRVLIEEALSGEEISVIAICDGRRAYPLDCRPGLQEAGRRRDRAEYRRHGRLFAYPFCRDDDTIGEVMERAILPTLHALYKRGINYRGALYAGVMLTEDGPKILEFNVRFGDPEAQVLLPRCGPATSPPRCRPRPSGALS